MKNTIARRDFLSTLAGAAPPAALGPASAFAGLPSGPALTVEAVEVFPITYPMDGRFTFCEDPQGTLTGRASAIVKLTASDGTAGSFFGHVFGTYYEQHVSCK